MKDATHDKPVLKFSGYQKFIVAVLAFLQFTIILDFMIISPLGAIVMPQLSIGPKQFGVAVSAYAFSAGIAGVLAAGFADRFDRKRLLLFFYSGFMLGTLLCALAPSYELLLVGRVVTGLFAGVVGSVVVAITTDLFPLEMRGRVMGVLQTAFAASQILGLPASLFFASHWNWHAPFMMIVAVGTAVGLIIAFNMQPVDKHLSMKQEHSPLMHLIHTVTEPRYLLPFATTALLALGGYMLMPFGSAFVVNNMKIAFDKLPTVYLVTGIATIFAGPLVGRASDRIGKFPVFFFGSAISVVMVLYYTRLGQTSLAALIAINVLLFVGIFSRMIPAQALFTAIPEPTKRGAFSSISSSLQQVSGGVASALAGIIVAQAPDGHLEHFEVLGDVVAAGAVVTVSLMWLVSRQVAGQPSRGFPKTA
jgi:predicted MFS family arabinose efflux permease